MEVFICLITNIEMIYVKLHIHTYTHVLACTVSIYCNTTRRDLADMIIGMMPKGAASEGKLVFLGKSRHNVMYFLLCFNPFNLFIFTKMLAIQFFI